MYVVSISGKGDEQIIDGLLWSTLVWYGPYVKTHQHHNRLDPPVKKPNVMESISFLGLPLPFNFPNS